MPTTTEELIRWGDRMGAPRVVIPSGTFDEAFEATYADGTDRIAYKQVSIHSAESVNDWWEERRYENPPYKPGMMVSEITLAEDTQFVRVYDGEVSDMYGGWVMLEEDIIGLTAEQIRDKYALPATPKYIVDVILPEGTTIRGGIANGVPGRGYSSI